MATLFVSDLSKIENKKLDCRTILVDVTRDSDISQIIESLKNVLDNNSGINICFRPFNWFCDAREKLSPIELANETLKFHEFSDELAISIVEDMYEFLKRTEDKGNNIYVNYSSVGKIFNTDYCVLNDNYVHVFDAYHIMCILEEIADSINEMNLSQFEQIFACYVIAEKWFKANNLIEKLGDANTCFTAFLDGNIVCSGFSDIFSRLLSILEIDNQIVFHSFGNDMHVRNKVYINDDEYGIKGWYFFDTTFAQDVYSRRIKDKFLNSDDITFFGVSNDEIPLLIISKNNIQEQCRCFYDPDISNVPINDDKRIKCLYNVYKKIYNDSVSNDEIKKWIDYSISIRHLALNNAFELLKEQNNNTNNAQMKR